MSSYSMEVFADVHREGRLEAAATRRLLRGVRRADATEPAGREPRWGAIGRGLTWLARLARPDRPAAAS